jgi:hypothetical protein
MKRKANRAAAPLSEGGFRFDTPQLLRGTSFNNGIHKNWSDHLKNILTYQFRSVIDFYHS